MLLEFAWPMDRQAGESRGCRAGRWAVGLAVGLWGWLRLGCGAGGLAVGPSSPQFSKAPLQIKACKYTGGLGTAVVVVSQPTQKLEPVIPPSGSHP